MSAKSWTPPPVINVGVLGHVDSGKTSLCAAISTVLSTAALDKSPQSAQRGITLDLQFSAFTLPLESTSVPEQRNSNQQQQTTAQEVLVTLVDCPGHASLIRTIIGGAQIIDMVLLVIDVQKGIQTQTAECIVVAEITTSTMIVVLNKIDLIPPSERAMRLEKVKAALRKTLNKTKFKNAPIVPIAARPGGGGAIKGNYRAPASLQMQQSASLSQTAGAPPSGAADANAMPLGLDDLKREIAKLAPHLLASRRPSTEPFLMLVDHCFPIKGKGTVCTGTILRGQLAVEDTVEFPHLNETRKVKSMQIFKQNVTTAKAGDRVGVLVTQLDSDLMERGLLCAPHTVAAHHAVVATAHRIRYFKSELRSKVKLHCTIGHETTTAEFVFFTGPPLASPCTFSFARDYRWLEFLPESTASSESVSEGVDTSTTNSSTTTATPPAPSPVNSTPSSDEGVYVLIQFEKPIFCPSNALYIASKLDTDIQQNTCRLAFHGRVVTGIELSALSNLRVYKSKTKQGEVDRVVDAYTVVVRNLFRKETDLHPFVGLRVHAHPSSVGGDAVCVGTIEGPFGTNGRVKVKFTTKIDTILKSKDRVTLSLKRYVFESSKTRRITQ
jgi:selenocysteine-specific elongation factor